MWGGKRTESLLICVLLRDSGAFLSLSVADSTPLSFTVDRGDKASVPLTKDQDFTPYDRSTGNPVLRRDSRLTDPTTNLLSTRDNRDRPLSFFVVPGHTSPLRPILSTFPLKVFPGYPGRVQTVRSNVEVHPWDRRVPVSGRPVAVQGPLVVTDGE